MRTLLALLVIAAAPPVAAQCPADAEVLTVNRPLGAARAAIAEGRLTILAMGSSSIEGVGASAPELSFVPLLEQGLETRLPGVVVTVVNRGVGGENAGETAARFPAEIEAAQPDLILWQLGANDVLQNRSEDAFLADFRAGQALLADSGADVIVIDSQRVPEDRDLDFIRGRNPALGAFSALTALEAGRVGYGVFHRFDTMAGWSGLDAGGVGPDGLHLNDAGYACWAKLTAESLVGALR
ncbi:SGNH/GDSL hydrolase family protein [Brevundimonas sp.]|uniref:SGNH/GDSL hydrolase family protein n=1 Tax=Brevundimonas sp. TaxID=1871086 RepID=UPI0025C1F0FD|nr:SGNH/GDSL hydrolase family protein [Brevundimonas sp.]